MKKYHKLLEIIRRKWKLDNLKPIDIFAPMAIGILFLLAWELLVAIQQIPEYLLPSPRRIIIALINDGDRLLAALAITARIAILALIAAIISGVTISIVMSQGKWLERSLFPYAVLLQTMPIAAIAPLIIVWLKNDTLAALVVCAWLAAVFPIIANTTFGLNSSDRTLSKIFQLYGASPLQTLMYLRWPSAMPYFFAGVRISGGLALIGAVVAEFVAGTGGKDSGIAYQILMAGYNLEIPKMFAALWLVTGLGIAIFTAISIVSTLAIGYWHESNDR